MSAVTPDRIATTGYAYREARLLLSAVELQVFTVLGAGPRDLDGLVTMLGIDRRGARDFLDALVALRLLDRDDDGRYANTPETALYLDRGKPTYMGGELDFIGAELFERWSRLTAALRSGKPQTGAAGASAYQDRYADPARLQAFADAMTAATLPVARALADALPWREHRVLVDIGSAQGCLPVAILKLHPHLTACGFDLPPLRPVFEAYVRTHGLERRLRFQPGDFFVDPLPAGDVMILGRVLHNWDLPAKRMLLEKAHAALPAGGILVVYERFIDDERRSNARAMLSSLNMLLMTDGGYDFTAADCTGWLHDAGFTAMRRAPLTGDHDMIVAVK
jgi:hypothetical protein